MRIRDWSSDVCSSDRLDRAAVRRRRQPATLRAEGCGCQYAAISGDRSLTPQAIALPKCATTATFADKEPLAARAECQRRTIRVRYRSEEHTSELQSLMRISYAVFCLKKKKTQSMNNITN